MRRAWRVSGLGPDGAGRSAAAVASIVAGLIAPGSTLRSGASGSTASFEADADGFAPNTEGEGDGDTDGDSCDASTGGVSAEPFAGAAPAMKAGGRLPAKGARGARTDGGPGPGSVAGPAISTPGLAVEPSPRTGRVGDGILGYAWTRNATGRTEALAGVVPPVATRPLGPASRPAGIVTRATRAGAGGGGNIRAIRPRLSFSASVPTVVIVVEVDVWFLRRKSGQLVGQIARDRQLLLAPVVPQAASLAAEADVPRAGAVAVTLGAVWAASAPEAVPTVLPGQADAAVTVCVVSGCMPSGGLGDMRNIDGSRSDWPGMAQPQDPHADARTAIPRNTTTTAR